MPKQEEYTHPFEISERAETNLTLLTIGSPLDANEIFGKKHHDGSTPIVCTPTNSNCFWWTSIPYGSSAIVTRLGQFVGIFEPGFHWFPPWYTIQYLVNTQHIPYNFCIKECPTRDNVKIKIDVDILFRVHDAKTFVYDIGPEKLEELLRASQAESVRSLVRSSKVSEAYDLRGSEGADMINSLNDKIGAYGVKVEQVIITNVTLPPSMAVTMQSETTFQSKQTEQRKRQEYDLKVLNDNNYSLRVAQDRENERRKATEEAKRSRALITQDIQSLEANMEKILQEIKAQEQSEVTKVRTEANQTVLKINADKDKLILELKAKQDAEVRRIQAETDKYFREVNSKADVVVAENTAKALELIGEAEQKASKKLIAKRKFEIDMQNVQIWNKVASNANIIISSDENNPLTQSLFT